MPAKAGTHGKGKFFGTLSWGPACAGMKEKNRNVQNMSEENLDAALPGAPGGTIKTP
jgi:hypothetical protein